MNLNDLLKAKGIDPAEVLVFRHRPTEPELAKALPWLAAEEPRLFNAYQQTQDAKLEGSMKALSGKGYVASFIARGASQALFVGLYAIGKYKALSHEQFWKVPEYQALKSRYGMVGFTGDRPSVLHFELTRVDTFYPEWQGRLLIQWPPPDRSWWRRADRNDMAVVAILEEAALTAQTPPWNELNLGWQDLHHLPSRWESDLKQWRGIYYIFDAADGKGYVGSAGGADNLLGRWRNYRANGHGGNKLLKGRQPDQFRFSILERLSPDAPAEAVVQAENTWKRRLNTRAPLGLNDN